MSFKDQKAIFARLEKIASQANLTKEERAQYEEEWKIYNDYFNTIESAQKKAATESWEKGMEEGMKEGLEKGIEKGMEKGRIAEQHRIAKALKETGTPINTIAQVTGLSQEEIENL